MSDSSRCLWRRCGGQRRLNKVQIEIGSTDWKEQSSIIHFMGEHAL